MDAKLPQFFNYLSRIPYEIKPVAENIAPKYPKGSYRSPTISDQPRYYLVNTFGMGKRPLYALTALTLHGAVPGHH
jgi:uncharacterized protein (DUF885 family)